MLLSKSCVYGLRASIYLATKDDTFVPIKKMSNTLEISPHFLTKILQQLTAKDLLVSYKGPNGGIKLNQPPDSITLLDVVLAIDGPDLLTECALGLPGCGHKNPCPLHDKWTSTRDSIRHMLESSSLRELVERGKKENLRLTTEGDFEKLLNG
ncbi:MAG: Rrf2 family transcriptional regulator [Bacteroidetes bacterium]|jgi:Rrf2 family protein|nr:Rrf2 family transcriptional regulator [Bacteroidota bacterium]